MLNETKPLRQLVILSGKGGTGKTSVAAGLMHLSALSTNPGVFADADVDAANLALVTEAVPLESHAYWGSQSAEINAKLCDRCDLCFQICRFNAIHKPENPQQDYSVIDLLCEGCAACAYICPQSAINMSKQQDGEWFHSRTPYGHLFHAELFPGAENTGKLVTTVKQFAKLYAEDHNLKLMIIDGPPGIGCPAISASGGADLALLVAEPGVSGLHDLERIIQTLDHFNVPRVVCINKADIYPTGTTDIEKMIESLGLTSVGMIPFDPAISESIIHGQPITKFSLQSPAALAIKDIWSKLEAILFTQDSK
jgi:MinD superfamily P-loop ATPase